MARGGRGGHQVQKRPVDLTGIISVTEKNDIITLVNSIMDKMSDEIYDLFDIPKPVGEKLGNLENELRCLSLDTSHPSQTHTGNGRPTSSSSSNRVSKKPPKTNDATSDLSIDNQLGELQKEAIAFFGKWQASVVQRLAELSVSEQPLTEVQSGRGRNGRNANRARGGGWAPAKPANGRSGPVVPAGILLLVSNTL